VKQKSADRWSPFQMPMLRLSPRIGASMHHHGKQTYEQTAEAGGRVLV
jgi:hypothetical protein